MIARGHSDHWTLTDGLPSYLCAHTHTHSLTERVKQVQSQLRSEQRQLDREIRSIDQGVAKAKAEVKRLAKKEDLKSAKILAREVVRSNVQRNRLVTSKARLNSIGLQLNHQMAMYKVTGAMAKSAEVMKLSNQLVKLPQLQANMRQMQQELMKAGIMEEMMEDTLEGGVLGEDEEELEGEAQDQVDNILFELTDGELLRTSFFRPSHALSPCGCC